VLGWRGLRGAFSRLRDLIIFLAFTVILATLVGQELTLKPLIAKLRLKGRRCQA
jgi:NhaP-type Na+/H+ or K+/H+ antiporter